MAIEKENEDKSVNSDEAENLNPDTIDTPDKAPGEPEAAEPESDKRDWGEMLIARIVDLETKLNEALSTIVENQRVIAELSQFMNDEKAKGEKLKGFFKPYEAKGKVEDGNTEIYKYERT